MAENTQGSPALFWPSEIPKNPNILKKSLYAVTETLPGNTKRITTACVVQKEMNNVQYNLLTWREPEHTNAKNLIADRYCSQYPKHVKKHRITEIDSPQEGAGLTFIPLKDKPDKHLKLVRRGMLDENEKKTIKQKFSAHTFLEEVVVQLDFEKKNEKYELNETIDPKLKDLQTIVMPATGAPIIVELNREDVVIGVLGLCHSGEVHPFFLEESGIGKYNLLVWYWNSICMQQSVEEV